MAFKVKMSLNQGGVVKEFYPFTDIAQMLPITFGPNVNGILAVNPLTQSPLFLINSGILSFEIRNDDSRIIIPSDGSIPSDITKQLKKGG